MKKLVIVASSAVVIGGLSPALAKTSEAECTTKFEQADANNDGNLQPNEAEVYVVAMEKVQMQPKDVMLVTRAEFLVACKKDAFATVVPTKRSEIATAQSNTEQPVSNSPAKVTTSSEQGLASPAQGVLASSLIGTSVYTASDQSIGEINDLILDRGNAASDKVIVGVGGFLGIGEKDVILDRSRLNFIATANQGVKIVVDTTETELKNLPTYNKQQ